MGGEGAGHLDNHQATNYHKGAKQISAVFKSNFEANIPNVICQTQRYDESQLEKNKKALMSIMRGKYSTVGTYSR